MNDFPGPLLSSIAVNPQHSTMHLAVAQHHNVRLCRASYALCHHLLEAEKAARAATRRAMRTATRTVRAARSILCIYNNYESHYLVASTTEVFYAHAWTREVFYPKFNGSYRDVKAREVLNEVRDLIKKLPALIEVHELINTETS